MWSDRRDLTLMLMANQPSTQTNPMTVNHLMNPHWGSLLASRFTLTDVDAIFVAVSCTTPHSNVLVVVTGSALQLDRGFQVTGSTVGKVYYVNYFKTNALAFKMSVSFNENILLHIIIHALMKKCSPSV